MKLTQAQTAFLEEIRNEKNGVPFAAAHTMILPSNNFDGKNQLIISELIAYGMLEIVEYENTKFLRAKEIPTEREGASPSDDYGYHVIGFPHSPLGMKTLRDEFESNPNNLFLVLGTTSYEMFNELLLTRMSKGYSTTFIYPTLRTTPIDKKDHYKQEKQKWEEYIKNLAPRERRLIEFRIADRNFDCLKNSLFAKNHARINVRIKNSNTSSRKGILIRCEENSTMYELAQRSYEDLLNNSHPDFFTDPFRCLGEFLKQHILKITVVFVFTIMALLSPDTNTVVFGFLSGFISDMILDWVKGIKWRKKELF